MDPYDATSEYLMISSRKNRIIFSVLLNEFLELVTLFLEVLPNRIAR